MLKLYPPITIIILVLAHGTLQSQIIQYSITPGTTDNRIKSFNDYPHQITYNKTIPAKELLIYFPSSSEGTGNLNLFSSLSASYGYVIVALSGPRTDILYDACAHNTDLQCFESFHREMLEGKNFQPFITVDSTEGYLYRLRALLLYLQKNNQDIDWSVYLQNNSINFTKTIWSGHDDGAARALVVAKYNDVKKVICFSGPKDFILHYYYPPPWLNTGNWKTDKSKMYAFVHANDEYDMQKEILDSLGLMKFGKPVDVMKVGFPYNNSHHLTTTFPVAIGDRNGSTVIDTKTPKINGTALFEPVWKYVLDIPITTPTIESRYTIHYSISPNPIRAGHTLKIEVKDLKKIHITDHSGRKITELKSNQSAINLIPGLYFITVTTTQNQTETKKLLVY